MAAGRRVAGDMGLLCGVCGCADTVACDECDASMCAAKECAFACAACGVDVCSGCRDGDYPLCTACVEASVHREAARLHGARRPPASPVAFQKRLDKISRVMGLDAEPDLRGPDGLERWPPIGALHTVALSGGSR